jgi:hypothetical protein
MIAPRRIILRNCVIKEKKSAAKSKIQPSKGFKPFEGWILAPQAELFH